MIGEHSLLENIPNRAQALSIGEHVHEASIMNGGTLRYGELKRWETLLCGVWEVWRAYFYGEHLNEVRALKRGGTNFLGERVKSGEHHNSKW